MAKVWFGVVFRVIIPPSLLYAVLPRIKSHEVILAIPLDIENLVLKLSVRPWSIRAKTVLFSARILMPLAP